MVDTQHPLAGTDQSVFKWRNALQESVWGTRIFRVEKDLLFADLPAGGSQRQITPKRFKISKLHLLSMLSYTI